MLSADSKVTTTVRLLEILERMLSLLRLAAHPENPNLEAEAERSKVEDQPGLQSKTIVSKYKHTRKLNPDCSKGSMCYFFFLVSELIQDDYISDRNGIISTFSRAKVIFIKLARMTELASKTWPCTKG